jgi:hypothetical protein
VKTNKKQRISTVTSVESGISVVKCDMKQILVSSTDADTFSASNINNGNVTKTSSLTNHQYTQSKSSTLPASKNNDSEYQYSRSSSYNVKKDTDENTIDYIKNGNLIEASVDFTKIKASFINGSGEQQSSRLLLKVYDKGYIHLNCKEALTNYTFLSSEFDNCLSFMF